MSESDEVLIVKGIIFEETDKSPKEKNKRENKKINSFFKLIGYPNINNEYPIVSIINDFVGEYAMLRSTNGGEWYRMDGTFGRTYKYVIRDAKGELKYSWVWETEEKKKIEKEFENINSTVKGNTNTHIKFYGKKESIDKNPHNIRQDIKDYFKNYLCVVCGNSDIETDHKNGLYNDPRISDTKTQTIEDFQPLCKHCNCQKRQSIVLTKSTGKRYKATNIPQLKVFGIDFTSGDENYDPNDINAMVGTYWYDPVDFLKKVREKYKIEFNHNYKYD